MMTAKERLQQCGVSMTKPREVILDYLMHNHIHPTVDVIYEQLKDAHQHLSRTTVYNTINLFNRLGLVTMLSIDEKQICVDENTTPHGHLLCTKCGRVIDLPLQGVSKANRKIEGNLVQEVHQYYKGICKECLNKSES